MRHLYPTFSLFDGYVYKLRSQVKVLNENQVQLETCWNECYYF